MAENNKLGLRDRLNKLLHICIRNWPWKLLSFVLAICIWSWLITQDETLTREKVFSDVPITVQNADTLRRSGYIVTQGLDDLPTVRIRVDVPQRNYNTVTAANYNMRIDLSRIHGEGEQTVSVLGSNSNTYGTITDQSVNSVTLQVEEYVTRSRIPVRLNTIGSAPDGFYAGDARVDPSYVVVSGPKSLVEQVVRCVADFDMSAQMAQSGTERTAVPFRLVDADGNEISRALIDVTSESVSLDSVTVEQPLYMEKAVVINTTDLVSGTPQAGYAIKRVSAEPATIEVAGSDDFISALTELHLVEFVELQIDVSNLSTNVTRRISLTKPSYINHYSSDTVIVTVEIAPQ